MKNGEGWWKTRGIEVCLLVLVLFLTAMIFHMYAKLQDMRSVLDARIGRVDRGLEDLKTQVDERFDLLDESLVKRFSRLDRGMAPLEGPVFRTKRDTMGLSKGGEGGTAEPYAGLSLGTVVHPEVENLALNWGILRKAFPKRLQDSKRAYLELIDQLGFPVTEQQRKQMRKVVHETFGLVECITTSAGWAE